MTCAEELAKFVVLSSFEDLSGQAVNQLKIRVLDALGCAIGALDEVSEDGDKVGDELAVGDVLTVILTSKTRAVSVSKDKVYMNVPLEEVLAFSFLYTADMAENYAIFKMYKQPKGE